MSEVGTLTIRNVGKQYHVKGARKLDVLSDINLDVAPGEFVYHGGESGKFQGSCRLCG